jgi:hypothetical protein
MDSFGILPLLKSKIEVDRALQFTEDLVVVLRFGKEDECLVIDDIVSDSIVVSLLTFSAYESISFAGQNGKDLSSGH